MNYRCEKNPEDSHPLGHYPMIKLTYLPPFVQAVFREMPGVWKSRHQLLLCWLIFMQAVYPGPKKLKEQARWTPTFIAEWRFRRLLKATYWSIHVLVRWLADEAIETFPAPEDGILYLIGDGSEKPKRGKKHPVAQKGRKSNRHPYFFGLRFVILMAAWDVYRIPVGFRLIRPKTHPDYQTENALFRQMVAQFVPPTWAKMVIVQGDAAYGSKANMHLVKQRDKQDCHRDWRFVFGIARTWNRADGKSLKDLVNHLPKKHYKRTWIPKLAGENRRKALWIYGKKMKLAHIGDVMMVLSKTGRNVGPKKTKLIVTNLTECMPRQIAAIYQRRWSVELLMKALKSGLGLGEHQVTKTEDRVEKSVGIALLAYLFLIRAGHQQIQPGQSWSIFKLQNAFRLKVVVNQVQHNMELKMKTLEIAA